MHIMQAFQQACAEFPQFRQQIVQAHDLTPDPGIRAQLDKLLTSMDESFREVKESFPRAVDDLTKRRAKVESEVKEVTQRLADADTQRQEAEAAMKAKQRDAAAAMPTVPKRSGLDPILAAQLRQEVLERFGGWRKPPGGVARLDREIWEDWTSTDRGVRAGVEAAKGAYAEPEIEDTPAPVIAALLQLAGIESGDTVFNLGCGDGRLLISAASKYGVRGVGIDSKAAAEVARDNLRTARLTRLVTIDPGAPLTADVSAATAVFLTLGTKQNSEMQGSLLRQLRAGARIVTHQGGLSDWQADEEKIVQDAEGKTYRLRLWKVQDRERGPSSSIGNLSEGDWNSRVR